MGIKKLDDPVQEAPLAPWPSLGSGCLKRGRWVVAAAGVWETVQLWAVGGGKEEAALRPATVLGVWPDGSDGTDINSLCRSHNERVVAVADDFCKVHLFQYPCARAKVRPPGVSRSLPGRLGLGAQGAQSAQLDLPSNPGTKSRVRWPWKSCDQRPVHSRRLAPHLAGRQGRQYLPVASAGCRGRGASSSHALSNPLPVPRLLSRRLTAAGLDPPALGVALPHPNPRTSGRPFLNLETFLIAHFPGGGERHPCTHCIDPLTEPGSPSLGPDSRCLLRGNKPKAKSPPSPFVGRGWAPSGPFGGGDERKERGKGEGA